MIINRMNEKKHEICKLLPLQAREWLVTAGKSRSQIEINAAHRYARAMHPEIFRMDDDSHAVQITTLG